MIIKGKYTNAEIFANVIESEAMDQIRELCNQEYLKDCKIAIMPDCHAGAGCTVGTTIKLNNAVCPNTTGVDIGCGMYVVKLGKIDVDFEKLDNVIRTYIPSGMNKHEVASNNNFIKEFNSFAPSYRCKIDRDNAERSLGSLGGGNHFVELNKDLEGNIYLVIHSGSRHLGIEVRNYYMERANDKSAEFNKIKEDLINKLKREGRQREIQNELSKLVRPSSTRSELAYVEGKDFDDYIHDMKLTQRYASLNRMYMASIILSKMGWKGEEYCHTIHNYIDTDNMILRKGSISLQEGEIAIIPINMRDGSLIVRGKGNPDYNYSGPHGAGRLMSRSKAKENISLEEFEESMKGVYTTSVGTSTIDEAPQAYKSIDDILPCIEDTCELIDIIEPIYNFKAS